MATSMSVSEWKKRVLKNKSAEATEPVGKALEEYGRVKEADAPEVRIGALEKVIEAGKTAKKANLKNKDLVAYLDDLLADADKELTRTSKLPRPGNGEDEEGEELKARLNQVKKIAVDHAKPFVLALGQIAGLVIARRPPITRDQRNVARSMRTGRGKLLEGRCYGERGKYVFELEEKPPGGLTKLIKKAAKVHAGMDIRLLVRGGGIDLDDETDLEEMTDFGSEPTAEATVPSTDESAETDDGDLRAEWERAIHDWELRSVEALRLRPDKADAIQTIKSLAVEQAEAGEFSKAVDTLGRLDEFLTAPIMTPQPNPEASAQFDGRLKELVKEAIAVGGPAAKDLKLIFSQARTYARKLDFDLAEGLLNQAQDRLNELAPVSTTVGPNAGPRSGTVATLRREATSALEAAAAADSATFVKRLETARIKADLLKHNGDVDGARDVIAQAFELVQARQGQDGFDGEAHPEIGKIKDRAFSLGVLKGGLKGGGGGHVLLQKALEETDPDKAMELLNAATQLATQENDLGLVTQCAVALVEAGAKLLNATACVNGAQLLAALKDTRATEATVKAGEVVIAKKDPNLLLRAAHLARGFEGSDELVAKWCVTAAELSFGQPLETVLGTVQRLAHLSDGKNVPPELLGHLAVHAIEGAQKSGQPGDMIQTADLMIELSKAGLLPKEVRNRSVGLVVDAAKVAGANGQSREMISAAEVLRDSDADGALEIAAKIAFEAGNVALLAEAEAAKLPDQAQARKEALDDVIEAVSLLANMGTAGDTVKAAVGLAKIAGERAVALQDNELLLSCGSAVLEFDDPSATSLGVEMAKVAGTAAVNGKRPDQAFTAARQLLGVADRSSTADAVTLATLVAQLSRGTLSVLDPLKNPEMVALAGSQMAESAEILAADKASWPLAVECAGTAAEIALQQKDNAELIRAAVLLKTCNERDKCLKVASAAATNEAELLDVASLAKDGEALLEHAQRCLVSATLIADCGGNSTALVSEVANRAGALALETLSEVDQVLEAAKSLSEQPALESALDEARSSLDQAHTLVAGMKRLGINIDGANAIIAKAALAVASLAAKASDGPGLVTLLDTALENDPGQITQVLEQSKAFCQIALSDTSGESSESLLDCAHLLLKIGTKWSNPELVDFAGKIGNRVLTQAQTNDPTLVEPAKGLIESAKASLSPVTPIVVDTVSVATTDVFKSEDTDAIKKLNYSSVVTKFKTYRGSAVVHYKSAAAAVLSNVQRVAVDGFAETVTKSTHDAYLDLVGGKFQDWDKSGAHLCTLLKLQADWQAVEKNKPLLYDLQKVRATQAGKQLENNAYNKQIAKHLKDAGWPDKDAFDEKAFLKLRKQAHEENPKVKQYAEDRSIKMLHTKAGYLIEERTYQNLPGQDEVAWTEQDTGILGGGTRPDITLPIKDGNGKVALMDITARNSQGHIFDKSPSWTDSTKVVDSVEVMYPSLAQPTLIAILLDKQAFSAAEAQERQEAYEAKVAAQASEAKALKDSIAEAIKKYQVALVQSWAGGETPARHLIKYYQLGNTKGYGKLPQTPKPEVAEKAYASLLEGMKKFKSNSM
jgi:hypothetical protein